MNGCQITSFPYFQDDFQISKNSGDFLKMCILFHDLPFPVDLGSFVEHVRARGGANLTPKVRLESRKICDDIY